MAPTEEASWEEGEFAALPNLSPPEMRTLAYASAIGREFDFPLLVAATGATEEALAEQLERLTLLGILRESPGGDRFTFVKDETRARVYQALTASRLRVLHRKVAEAMEHLVPTPPPELIPELGRHYFLGKVPEPSYRYNRAAAELARQNGRPEEAAHHLERARIDLRALPGDHASDEAAIAEELGDIYYATGDVRAADHLYGEGLQKVGEANPRQRARLLLARSEVARRLLDVDRAHASAREARDLFQAAADDVGLASVHRVLGRIAFHQGAYRDALDEAIQALELLRGSQDDRTLGRLSVDIGNAFAMLGPEVQDDAADWYRRAVERLSEVGDWADVARALLNLGVLVGQKNPMEGLEYLSQGLTQAERVHEHRWSGWGLAMGVDLRLRLGQVEEAERDNEQAARLLERANDPLGLQQVATNVGLIAERHGQWEDAEKAFRGSLADAERLRLKAETALLHFYLARLFFKMRNLDLARQEYARASSVDFAALNPPAAAGFRDLGRQLSGVTRPEGPPASSGPRAP